jgi:hypothetical protein
MAVQSYGRDVNQIGTSQYPRTSTELPEVFYSAIVEDIVVNENGGKFIEYEQDGSNLGEILFRAIPQDINVDIKQLSRAKPMNISTMEFPLIGDPVIVFRTNGGAHYTNRVNTSNVVSNSISPALVALTRPAADNTRTQDRKLARLQVAPPANPINKIDTSVVRNVRSRHVRASPGDTIVQGRFGNTIRLGSSLFQNPITNNPSPNIILTAGQWSSPKQLSTKVLTPFSSYYENINEDRSSIWMVSNQKVAFKPATKDGVYVKSSEVSRKENLFDGAQIFINSDRVILNSKLNEIALFSNLEINLSARKSITIDTESSIFLTSNNKISLVSSGDIILRGKKVTISSTGDLSYKTSGIYSIIGKKIFIGRYGDTSQPMVLGGTLALWLQAFMKLLLAPGAIQTLTGPAIINPVTLVALKGLQRQLGTEFAPQQAIFNSKGNYTSETNPA